MRWIRKMTPAAGTIARIFGFILWLLALPSRAQMPFYTDDPAITGPRTVHVEIFDELDGLQSSQYPDLRQNTANIKINISPLKHLEIDFDAPFIVIQRDQSARGSRGVGDTNLGAKWNFREAEPGSTRAAYAISFYLELPTGSARQETGSGLTDYWLNFVMQKPLSDATRVNFNAGILFAGNTSTGVVGIETRHGQVYTGGVSLIHDVNSRVSLGGELYGGVSDGAGQDRTQLQAMAGAQLSVVEGLSLSFGVLAGRFGATPRIGGQIGFSMDFPQLWNFSRSRSEFLAPQATARPL